MKKILISIGLLGLLVMPACAVPPFVSTLNHAVTVNSTTGVLVGGDTNLFKNNMRQLTNDLAQAGYNGGGGTTLVPYITTNYYYTTNYGYVVAGAGTTSANGAFVPDAGSIGGNVSWAFTNSVGSKLQYWVSAGYWNISAGGFSQAYAGYGSTNTAAGLTYQIVSGASPVPTVTAGIVVTNIGSITTNMVPVWDARLQTNANASTFFGSGQIPPQLLPASSTFTGTITNLASVPFAVATLAVTNTTTNFLVVSSSPLNGNYYFVTAATGVPANYICPTNGCYMVYNPSGPPGGIYIISGPPGNDNKAFSSNPIGTYANGAVVTAGTGSFTYFSTNYSVTVTANTTFHYNLTTYQNGICVTNFFQ
ncbi:MAG: hypothetical protein KGL39_36710 [Patescibacteria group bacterium]|nr:hypothetical protein [Patescibacteria group bacterium]